MMTGIMNAIPSRRKSWCLDLCQPAWARTMFQYFHHAPLFEHRHHRDILPVALRPRNLKKRSGCVGWRGIGFNRTAGQYKCSQRKLEQARDDSRAWLWRS
jgi:hypothetical protein